ncbi:DMT family transporter [Vibrio hangzhouensis]|uniref:EamA domain-containing membrane protein RarD n=1 Tax=Vibrio hangzhouensis TaxID=462991 RepID=A0A1H5ZP07_9VIBR|nr:DMT family transporter [Vibrio hangzhouensis]SEG37942.1 EamA domain-containing membrane protein RarD [Vibrio hangzhouensis]
MHRSLKGEGYLFLATLFAAVGWVASKYVLQEMPSSSFIGGRFLIASTLLLPFCFRDIRQISKHLIWKLIAVGSLLALSIHVWVYAVSITQSLSEGAFIMSLAMIIAPLTRWLLFKQHPNRAFWLSLPIAVLGMMFLTLTNGWNIDVSQGYFLLSSCLLSVHFVLNKRASNVVSPLSSICLQMSVVGLSGLLLYLLDGAPSMEFSVNTWGWFIIATFIATALRYLTQTVGQHSANIEVAALIMILEPIWTLIMSVTLLGESLSLYKSLGSALIVLSLYLYIRLSRHG